MKKKVLLRGPVFTQSGYGVHARQIAKWLIDREDIDLSIQALQWGETPWIINEDLHDGMIGRLLEKTVDPNGKLYDVSVQLQLPNEWDTRIAKKNIGITASVETDRCNPEWIKYCNAMSMVIVPSKHAASSLTSSGDVKVPLHVINESYSPVAFKTDKTKIDELDFSTSFNFLIFGQLTGNNPENDRKNIFYAIKWICEAFKNDKDVGIVVKTNAGRNTKIDRKMVLQLFEGLLKEVRRSPFPKVHLIHGDMSDEEVYSLYRHPKIKSLVSLTRGEGYGLPILEAAVSGLPVIATGWSGHTEFLSNGRYIDVDYKLEEIHPTRIDDRIFMKGSKWANPSEDDFKRKIAKFRSASAIPKEWALELQEKLIANYSHDAIVNSYNEITRGIL
jgi:glycosyltransferase involved in cell wall biosynthesis